MKQIKGFWLPDREDRLDELLRDSSPGDARYQRHKLQGALEHHQGNHGLALDIGAHVGLWSMQLEKAFQFVVAFEPDAEKAQCFALNASSSRVKLHRCGLSDHDHFAGLTQKSGTSLKDHVNLAGTGIELRTLDSFHLAPDFIKIDVEGYELAVIKGAVETIQRSHPTIILEQKPGVASKRYGVEDQAALRLLETWDYVIRAEFNGDFVMTHATIGETA